MSVLCKFSSKLVAFFGISASLLFLSTFTQAAQASETFSVDSNSGGMALNTNNQFRRIDGQPRMSLWQRNDNDTDQQFERLVIKGQPGVVQLMHRSTGKCINAHYPSNGSEFNVFPCNKKGDDIDQKFIITSLGSGYNEIKRAGTNLCIDSPTRANYGRVHLWTCDRNNANQRWKSSQTTALISLPDLQRLLFGSAPNVVTSSYGYTNCNIWRRFYTGCVHPALDIASPWRNPPIYSPVSGEVVRINAVSGTVGVYNAKANVTFFFHHMDTVSVRLNSLINTGTQVGTQGRRGYVTGPHLHFEARPGKTTSMANAMSQTINPVDGVNRANQ